MDQWILDNLGTESSTDLNLWWRLAIIAGIIIAAYLVDIIFKHLIIPVIQKLADRTTTQLDDILLSPKVCSAFSAILPPVVLTVALPYALRGELEDIVVRLTLIYIVYNVCRFLAVLLHAIYDILLYRGHAKARSLRGILQTLQIIVWIVGAILMISILINRSPVFLFTGLGASAAVLMLVFQDSIKGLVAGVQLSLNDMVRVGDWIAMPSRNVDGVVTEISLTTVKVRNWDNTIMTIMPYTLLTDTFQNWRGMSESDGRRLTRSVNVNMNTLRLLTADEISRYQSEGWLPATAKEGEATNLEAFRTCLLQHLRQMPEINEEMTLMVRQLSANPEGIPIQVYAFTHTKVWEEYEEIQARIIEYMIALMPQFDILPYQRTSDYRRNQ